jgi:hypothetical protein
MLLHHHLATLAYHRVVVAVWQLRHKLPFVGYVPFLAGNYNVQDEQLVVKKMGVWWVGLHIPLARFRQRVALALSATVRYLVPYL